uniref:PDZ domain-containing protein n=1 Tax=Macrostomum lignano TaxID=282301 RepID=A0A1I8GBJ3_9PLAT
APDGEKQPSVPVDLFVSIERLMVLNPTSRLAMMDHALRTVTHTADMDNLLVLMVRRAGCPTGTAGPCKVVCHLFHTEQVSNKGTGQHTGAASDSSAKVHWVRFLGTYVLVRVHAASQVAHTIGCAFNAAYAQFVRRGGAVPPKTTPGNDGDSVSGTSAVRVDFDNDNDQVDDSDNGLEDTAPLEVTIYKERGEALGIALVDSGWGALLPSVLLANLRPGGPAVRSGQLSVGDFLLAVDGTSLVGLPLAACRRRLRACRSAATVRLSVLPRPPVSEAVIQRLDPRRPLGFSVRDGVVCALLRGGVAERGGVRIGHRIVEIDGRSVAAAPHDRIVAALASAVGEVRLRTMPEAVYRLLTGLDSPRYV